MHILDTTRQAHLQRLNHLPGFQQVERLSLAEEPELRMEVIAFLNEELRPTADYSVEQEFPALFSQFPGGHSIVARMGDRIVSHVGVLVRDFHHASFRMRVGLIGSIATAPSFRNMGLASALLEEAVQDLKRRGCAVALLWSEREDYYRKFGFYRCGRETDFRFSPEEVPEVEAQPILVDPLEPSRHLSQLWRLYSRNPDRVDRSLEEWRLLLRIPRTQVFVTEDDNKKVTSYIAIHKGADFRDYIHEWAGDMAQVQQCVAAVQKHHFGNRNLTLIAPAHYSLSSIRSIATREWQGALGLMRVLDRKALSNIYIRSLASRLIPHSTPIPGALMQVDGKDYPIEEEGALLQLVFGSDRSTPEAAKVALPFFLWGYDSI